ncbi:MAG: ATP-binding cassette domain-containing protein, partial [Myxococcales bacterium]|nr:ATP-binding cassette domain-containing protein [Myxococcales bacterium]
SSEESAPVLKGVSALIPAGQLVALVGPSGAGKTTISSLIPRLYDVSEGSVTVDGHDVRDLTQSSLRDAIGVVSQDPHLFHDTVISDGGGSLSGGQRQRVAIARAVIRNPGIMLLDEATSALDNSTEKRVIENLERQRCTRITVAHRLSTVRNADLIVVMDKGRIVEQGTHPQLLHLNGLYARLVQASQNPTPTEIPHDAISLGSVARHGVHGGSHAHRA